jgi:hypothetical protein
MLAGFQDAFVALAADARLRRRFAAAPEAVLGEFELDAAERAALGAIPPSHLERFARSLVAKRWGELARVVRLTLRVAPSVGRRYHAWALEHPAPVVDQVLAPGVAEALRALPSLHQALARDEGEAAYAADLLGFEVRRAASRGDGAAREMTSHFPIHQIAADVARGLLPTDPRPAPTALRFEAARVRWRRA